MVAQAIEEQEPINNVLPMMANYRNKTVVDEEECRLLCYLPGKEVCTAYILDDVTLNCELFLVDFFSTDVMTL